MNDAELVKRRTDLLQFVTTPLRKVASTGGGEYAGSCPFCGGTDRFRVQPNHADGGIWFCRKCGDGKWHDVIDYVQRLHNTDFPGAMKLMGGDMLSQEIKIKLPDKKLDERGCDRNEWQVTASEFVAWSVDNLWNDQGEAARKYLNERGLNDETITRWMIGFSPHNKTLLPDRWGMPRETTMNISRSIVIPYFEDGHGVGKIQKIGLKPGVGKPYSITGSREWLYGGFTYKRGNIAYLLESNFDVMLADQIGANVGYAGLPAASKIKPCYRKYFATVLDLIVLPDNDDKFQGINGAIEKCKAHKNWFVADFVPAGSDLTDYWREVGDEKASEWLGNQANVIRDGSPHER